MRKMLLGFVAFCYAPAAFAQASGYEKITGEFVISGQDVTDPPEGQPKDRVGFSLTGRTASRIYKSMPAKPVSGDACEVGMKTKSAGGLLCASHADGSFTCSVAILLKSGQTRPSGAC